MRILADNYIKTATITPLTEATGYEFDTALKDTRLSRIARTTSKTYQHIDFDLLTAKSIDYCSVLNHNLTDTATATIQGFTNNPITDTTEEMYLPLELDALDISGNDNDGTATDIIYSDTPDMRMYLPLATDDDDDSDFGVTTTPTDITYGADGAIFNGSTSKIVTDLVITNLTGWSIDFEFKRNGLPTGTESLCIIYSDYSNRVNVAIDTSGYLFLSNRVSGVSSDTSVYKNANLCDNVVHKVHINLISTTKLQITVDNSADTVKTLTIALVPMTTPTVYIGTMGTNGTNFFTGTMKNLRIFNRNLTTAEITQLYTYNTFTALSKAVAVFNGSTSDVACGNVINNLTGCALSFWFKKNYKPDTEEFSACLYQDTNNYARVGVYINGSVSFLDKISGVFNTTMLTNSNLCDGLLHHVVLNIIDSTHLQFIVDGIAESIQTLTVALTTLTAPTLTIGALTSAATTYVLNGCLSDFCIFNRNLTTAEISNLYLYNSFSDFADTLVYSENIILKEFTASQSYRYWRLRVSDPTNTDNYISMSKFYLGTYIQLPYMAKNQKIPTASTSDVAESNDLQAYGDPGVFYRYGTVNFPNIEDADYTIMDAMFRLVDKYVPFILLIWENDLTFFPPLYTRITSDFDWTRVEGVTGRKWSLAFNFKESF